MKTTKRKQNWLEAENCCDVINIDGMPKYSDNYKRIRFKMFDLRVYILQLRLFLKYEIREFVTRHVND